MGLKSFNVHIRLFGFADKDIEDLSRRLYVVYRMLTVLLIKW